MNSNIDLDKLDGLMLILIDSITKEVDKAIQAGKMTKDHYEMATNILAVGYERVRAFWQVKS